MILQDGIYKMKTVAIIQARMGSTRFPGKVLSKIGGLSMLEIIYNRLNRANKIDKIIIATTTSSKDNKIENLCIDKNMDFYRGSEENVLDRFYKAAKIFKADTVVRITADCPLVDPGLVDEAINLFYRNDVDYLSNVNPPTYPDGFDIEVFNINALAEAHENAQNKFELEHVTSYIRENKAMSHFSMNNSKNLSNIRLTVDQPQDLLVIKELFKHFSPNIYFSFKEVIRVYDSDADFFKYNQDIERNEGMKLKTGQKLYKRAKTIIPGGNMLLSKRPEMWLPDQWPAYFQRAKGCKVWDLDNREYIDMASMGIGTNILGYSHPEVEEAVIKVVKDGNMSTLNCSEEVHLAEQLINSHPWFDMVKFARSGGEANAISIRIARAFTKKDKIAVCGYHGWHDWYLSVNLSEKDGLSKHLLSGLNPSGVPKGLEGTVLGFEYNNLEQLEEIINKNKDQVAAIKMEVKRNVEPNNNFLQKVRELANKNNIVLIFDECTSGFRETDGGLHKKYKVNPDIAIFGKALGNGHAITAVVGSKEVMQSAQDTFISSTFWTERIGPAAALKTLEIMEREKSWKTITDKGISIVKRWEKLASKHNLSIKMFGIPSLCGFNFTSKNALAYKTYITQEMLKKNFLCGNSIYSSIAHSQEITDLYFSELDQLFSKINDFENGDDVLKYLEGPICHSGFNRLN